MTSFWPDLRLALRGLASQPALCDRRDAVAGPWHRRQHGDLHADRPDPAAEAAGAATPEELVMLFQRGSHNGSNMGSRMHSYPIYQDYQQKAGAALAGHRPAPGPGVGGGRQPDRAGRCRDGVGQLLRRCSASGPPSAACCTRRTTTRSTTAIPSPCSRHDYWVSRFARDPGVIGKKIQVNNYPMTIVGVSAAGFDGIDPARLAAHPRADPDEARDGAGVDMDARRRPALPLGAGVCAAEAGSDRRKRCGRRCRVCSRRSGSTRRRCPPPRIGRRIPRSSSSRARCTSRRPTSATRACATTSPPR